MTNPIQLVPSTTEGGEGGGTMRKGLQRNSGERNTPTNCNSRGAQQKHPWFIMPDTQARAIQGGVHCGRSSAPASASCPASATHLDHERLQDGGHVTRGRLLCVPGQAAEEVVELHGGRQQLFEQSRKTHHKKKRDEPPPPATGRGKKEQKS